MVRGGPGSAPERETVRDIQMKQALPRLSRLLISILIVGMPTAVRADDTWQFGSVSSFSSGKYGTDSSTEVLHTPVTARRLFTNGDVTLGFPFTCIRGNGSVTVVNGAPVRRDQPSGASGSGPTRPAATTANPTRDSSVPARGADLATAGAAAPTSATGPAPVTPAYSVCGMGDLFLRGRYYMLDERGWLPTIAARGHVKLPTASASSGLGTGRPDEGLGIEVSRWLGRGAIVMVDGGFTLIGQPTGVDFNNSWWYDVGVGQDLANGVVNVSVFFEEYRSITPGFENARDVLTAVTLSSASGWRVQVSGQFGLSDGAPDHGITVGASRRF